MTATCETELQRAETQHQHSKQSVTAFAVLVTLYRMRHILGALQTRSLAVCCKPPASKRVNVEGNAAYLLRAVALTSGLRLARSGAFAGRSQSTFRPETPQRRVRPTGDLPCLMPAHLDGNTSDVVR